jgi:hypothetical protein
VLISCGARPSLAVVGTSSAAITSPAAVTLQLGRGHEPGRGYEPGRGHSSAAVTSPAAVTARPRSRAPAPPHRRASSRRARAARRWPTRARRPLGETRARHRCAPREWAWTNSAQPAAAVGSDRLRLSSEAFCSNTPRWSKFIFKCARRTQASCSSRLSIKTAGSSEFTHPRSMQKQLG